MGREITRAPSIAQGIGGLHSSAIEFRYAYHLSSHESKRTGNPGQVAARKFVSPAADRIIKGPIDSVVPQDIHFGEILDKGHLRREPFLGVVNGDLFGVSRIDFCKLVAS